MAKITSLLLQEKNKNRCNIYIDGEFFRGVSIDIAYKYRLKEGLEVSTEKLNRLVNEAEENEALGKAIEYLSKYFKTKKQLKDYLLKKGYSVELAYKVIDKLKEYNYINDVKFSMQYIESTSKSSGKKLIEYKLMSKGVKKEDIEKAYQNVVVNSKENALALAVKHIKNKEKTQENIQKTYRYLIGKGFSYEDAVYAVSQLKQDDIEEY